MPRIIDHMTPLDRVCCGTPLASGLGSRVAELEADLLDAYEALECSGWQRVDSPLMDRISTTLNLPE